MVEPIDFNIFPDLPEVPFLAKNGNNGLNLYVTSIIDHTTYTTINLSDGTSFNVLNGINGVDGVGIVSINRTSGTGLAGSLDTYTITYSDASTNTFTVQNGTDGSSGVDGIGITGASINGSGHLILTLTVGSPIDVGLVVGAAGVGVANITIDGSGEIIVTYTNAVVSNIGNIYTGVSATSAVIDDSGHLIITWPNGTVLDAGLAAFTGGGAISITYTFNADTASSNPGIGKLKLNNATQNIATVIRVNELDNLGSDWSTVIAGFADSTSTVKGNIRIFKTNDLTKWLLFSVSNVTSATGYYNLTVVVIGSSAASPFSDADKLTLAFIRTGDKGSTGATGVLSVLDNSSTDLNTRITTNDYIISDLTAGGLNMPSGATGVGELSVRAKNADIFQTIVEATGFIYTRSSADTGGSWSSWYKYTGTEI